MTLRERLIALADGDSWVDAAAPDGISDHELRKLALAAARMALDEAARECDKAAKVSKSVQSYGEEIGERNSADLCRSLAATLTP